MEIVLLPPDLGEMDVFAGICRVRWVGQNHLTAEACLEFPDNSILQEEFNAFLERNGTVMHFGILVNAVILLLTGVLHCSSWTCV